MRLKKWESEKVPKKWDEKNEKRPQKCHFKKKEVQKSDTKRRIKIQIQKKPTKKATKKVGVRKSGRKNGKSK